MYFSQFSLPKKKCIYKLIMEIITFLDFIKINVK